MDFCPEDNSCGHRGVLALMVGAGLRKESAYLQVIQPLNEPAHKSCRLRCFRKLG